jgi:hypothetical protein
MKRFLPLLVLLACIGPEVIARSAIRRVDFNNFTFHPFWSRRLIKLNGEPNRNAVASSNDTPN